MLNIAVAVNVVKNAFAKALKELPDFKSFNHLQVGDIVDKSFKSLMNDFMEQFGMQPNTDYIDNLNSNEPGADFVICSPKANDLIKDLLEGRVIAVKDHTRVSKTGKTFTVRAHFKKVPKRPHRRVYMKSKVFKNGNYVWECKTSPTPNSLGASVEVSYLRTEIAAVKRRWAKEGMPSGYYYVFPVNYISNTARQELENFKSQYRGQVDIGYYDCEQVQKLIEVSVKIVTMQGLISYIQQATRN